MGARAPIKGFWISVAVAADLHGADVVAVVVELVDVFAARGVVAVAAVVVAALVAVAVSAVAVSASVGRGGRGDSARRNRKSRNRRSQDGLDVHGSNSFWALPGDQRGGRFGLDTS